MQRVLVVDDEGGVRESLRMVLREECEVGLAAGVDEALAALADGPHDLVLLDLVMPGRSGFDLLRELARVDEAPPVVVLTGNTAVSTAVEAMQQGAVDYITKPFEVEALRLKVRKLLERRELEREVEELRARLAGRERLGELLGRGPAMQEVFRNIRRVAPARATVLLRGESGTGKELAARAIHDLSPRADAAFVPVNCAGIPEALIESELFGHERGAFTDARERRIGRFEQAHGGTLFLDEIGELAPGVQAKLLRALQERRIDRLGGSESVDVDVRVVAATHRDLPRDVADGRFRADLFYRINVVPLELPPLRERPEDVNLLAQHFLQRARAENGRGAQRLSRSARSALERHTWPGNVRELANAMERAVAMCEGELIEPADLPDSIASAARNDALRGAVRSGELGFEEATACFERDLIREALQRAGGNQTRAAELLHITRRVLKLKMDRHGIAFPS